jgi:putative PIN family toxin of toxin-antitoxin system
VDKALSRGVMLVSDETLSELADVLARPKFDRYVSRADRQQFLRLLGGVARKIHIQHRLEICRDPKDDKLLHVALNGKAQYLITGDGDLLVLSGSFSQNHGLRIVSPNDWLDLPLG